MSESRETILTRVRTALADRPAPSLIPREYDLSRTHPDLVGLAAERIADYRAEVWEVPEAQLADEIDTRLAKREVTTMIGPPGLPTPWQTPAVRWLQDEPSLELDALDDADGVLTTCAVVIAETGTIVLDGGTGQGRRALSLLPDYHLCVVRTDQIVATVPEALRRLDPGRPITLISGPSATSDIELDRVEGVHGPRTLHVLVTRPS
ncbi:LutC/YkgG family protein [Saccharopolyspora spinosa]|uniref:L-lactate dehydrogenase complex protein LldG n=1 Tax=Saccharopolyspora spinosa TaxID=60894 RepID=A0A2N3Y150_SACSN|nr:lactate utilization protein C [Saccharopolyspora spinosa]PKW16645.1 L-lactate dehydrogenase complex protein LldG [Saccharopolyspora spinosa]